eukprot:TRINITY_DN2189_c0_g1_i1.p1 TRINITY_DN2189_c0_g1~~TRINITY_DN2189_c0_g1_i1.p1  ORF type:complete len:131 (+),score=12.79 TRINITY_DN2189_c0_g1_i1:68-460(+)
MASRIQWSLWARSMALSGAYCLTFGSFAYIFAYDDDWPQRFIYDMIVSFIVTIFLYPLKYLRGGLIVVQNFYVNALLLVGLGVWPLLELPSILGGICLVVSGIFYLIAAVMGEKGMTMAELKTGPRQGGA